MSAISRNIRVRIAAAGAPAVEGNVAVTLGLDVLEEVPVVLGPIVDPTNGSSQIRPFSIRALDLDGILSAAFASGGRWSFVGRLVDVQANDDGAGWVTYGGGRLTALEEDDGPGRFRLEVSDESWLARRGGAFTGDNTTRLFPSTPEAAWRGYEAIPAADGRLMAYNVSGGGIGIGRIRVTAGFLSQGGQEVTEAFLRFAENDIVDNPDGTWRATAGSFETLRLNYDGTDYPIVSFAPSLPGFFAATDADRKTAREQLLATLREPTIEVLQYPLTDAQGSVSFTSEPSPYGLGRVVTIDVWILTSGGALAGNPITPRPAYVHAPDSPPTAEAPLHIGIADAAHPWGTQFGGLHPATLTRRVWDALGVRYDLASIEELEDDTSLPPLWLRVTETPENVERWLQENVWGPLLLAPFVSPDGVRRLIDLRIPSYVDPFELPLLDASNADAQSWRLLGSEAVTAIRWRYLNVARPASGMPEGEAAKVTGDGFIPEEKDWPIVEADTIETIGQRAITLSLFGALEPTDVYTRFTPIDFFGGVTLAGAINVISQDIFDLYRDGPVRGRIEVGRSTGDEIGEGDLIAIDQSSLKGTNPETGARTGVRVVRVLSIARHPAYAELEYLDMGPRVQPLGPPTVSLSQDGEVITAAIGNVAAGGTAIIECAFTEDSADPISWPYRATLSGAGSVEFPNAPGFGVAHVRAKNTAPQRIRSPYTTELLTLENQPRITKAGCGFSTSSFGFPFVRGTANSLTAGVRIRAIILAPTDVGGEPELATPSDFSVAEFIAGIDIEGIDGVPIRVKGSRIIVEIEPWDEYSDGAVSGNAGPRTTVSSPKVLFERPLPPTVEVKVLTTFVSDADDEGTGPENDDDWGGQGPQQPLLPAEPGEIVDPMDPEQQPENAAEQPRPGNASVNLLLTVRDPSGAGGRVSIWTNPTSELNANPDAVPDDVVTIGSTDAVTGTLVGPDDSAALTRVRIPSTGYGTKRMYFRFDSDSGATSGLVPPLDSGYRDNARSSSGRDRWDDLGRGGFDTGYAEKKALLEEMKQEFLAGFRGDIYLSPDEIRDSSSFFTLMDGEGQTISNLLLQSTVTDAGLRSIDLFIAKPTSADPDDLDSVQDGATYRRVISVDSEGRVTVDSLAAGSVTAFAINVGSLDELTEDMGILVSGQLIGTGVILDLGADSSDPILETDSLYILANGDAGFAGELLAASGTFFGDLTIGGSVGSIGAIYLDNYGTIFSSISASPGIAVVTSLDITLDAQNGAPGASIEMTSSANLFGGIYESYIDITATEIRLWGTVLVNGTAI